MLAETHCHCSEFSRDANRSLERLLQEAAQKNFSAVVLTDHYDKDYYSDGLVKEPLSEPGSPPKEGEWVFDIITYLDFIDEAKAKPPKGVSLLRGIEVGYRSDIVAGLNQLLKPMPFDQIIGSVHALNGCDLGFVKQQPLYRQEKEKAYAEVLDKHIEMVESDFDFQVMAHVDYLTRYAPYDDKRMRYEDHPGHFDRLFRALIRRDIALEVNCRTRYKDYDKTGNDGGTMDEMLLRRYYELGGRLITLASDAHEVGSLGRFFYETRSFLRELGFKEACFFQNRQPQLYRI